MKNAVKQKIKNPVTCGFVGGSVESYAYDPGEPERSFSKMVSDESERLSKKGDTMYLFRTYRGGPMGQVVTTEDLRVTPKERHRTKKIIGGMFREIEHAGWDRSGLTIRAVQMQRANGTEASGMEQRTVDNTAAGVKTVLRRLRPQEAELLAEADAEIAVAVEQLRAARCRRMELVSLAWTKAHVVRLNELDVKEP